MIRVSNEEWVERSNNIHSGKYQYPIERWGKISNRTLVPIVCYIHGEFTQSMSNHTHKTTPTGCPECSHTRQPTRNERVANAIEVHGAKYDYSLWPSEVSASTLVETLCIACNKTWTHNIDNHIRGRGCPNCKSRIRNERIDGQRQQSRLSKIEKCKRFISEANELHAGRYDYSHVQIPFNIKTPVKINCKKHGCFFPTMYAHISRGSGCPVCAGEKLSDEFSFGYSHWVARLSEVHPSYTFREHIDGSNTSKDKIDVKCPSHGWWVTSIDSLKTSGCPACKGHSQRYFYINSVDGLFIKYGIAKDPDSRLKAQNTKNKLHSKRIMLFRFDDYSTCRQTESQVKNKIKPVSNRHDLVDGWSETASFYELDLIIELVKSNGGVRVLE